MRAGSIRDDLELLDQWRPGARRAVLSRMPEPIARSVVESGANEWCPIEAGGWVTDGTCAMFGEQASFDFWVTGVERHLERPLFRSFVAAMRLLSRGHPERMVSLVPRGWAHVYRDSCVLTIEPARDRVARVMIDDIAHEVGARPSFLLHWRARFEGMARRFGGARLQWLESADHRSVEARFTW